MPAQPAVVDGSVSSGLVVGDLHVALEQYGAEVNRAANALRGAGVGAGDRVALLMRNDLAVLVASGAASKLGAAPVAINWHSTSEEVGRILVDSGASTLIAHPDLYRSVASVVPEGMTVALAKPSPALVTAYGLDRDAAVRGDADGDVLDWTSWLAEQEPTLQDAHASVLETTIMPDTVMFTSGTTGRSKGVRRLRGEPNPEAMEAARLIGVGPGVRHLVTGPLYHAAPGGMALHVVHGGGLTVLLPRFDAEEMLRLIEHYGITNLMLVPTMLVRVLDLPRSVRESYDLSSLQKVVHAAGPCSIAVKEAAIDFLGPVVCEYYGGTETGIITFATSADSLAKPGTVGKAAPGVTLRIVDEEGADVSAGEIGDIYIRNTSIPDFEYIGNEEARVEIERDGFVTQGDLGYLDVDGFLFLEGRRREMIVVGGVNVYTIEIENVVAELPGIRMAAAFPVRNDELGEVVGLAVECDGTAEVTREQITRHVLERLGRLKAPRLVEFDDTLSTNEAGKVFKQQLAARYAGAKAHTS